MSDPPHRVTQFLNHEAWRLDERRFEDRPARQSVRSRTAQRRVDCRALCARNDGAKSERVRTGSLADPAPGSGG